MGRRQRKVGSERRNPMTNAQRQAAYRKRHLQDVEGQGDRINMVVSVQAKVQLTRLATYYGVTRRELVVRVLADAESRVVDGLSRAAEKAYYHVTA